MLSEISQTKKDKYCMTLLYLYLESKKVKLHRNRVEWCLLRAEVCGNWEDFGQRVQTCS